MARLRLKTPAPQGDGDRAVMKEIERIARERPGKGQQEPEEVVSAISEGLYNLMVVTPDSQGHCVLCIQYEEFHPETYKGARLIFPARPDEEFHSGDPVVDYCAALRRGQALRLDVWMGSSLDNYLQDCRGRYAIDYATGLLMRAGPVG